MRLDDQQLYRALRAHDARFDGVFFVGVATTRIYCRPVCRAPAARAENCRFFSSAAAAERRGFRPCLRCRPELAPGLPGTASVDAIEQLAKAASERIAAGALNDANVDELAATFGVTSRHLRRVVERRLGASPVELAQTHRLLLAKRLLTETSLPIGRVAFASGFRSVRRFNTLFRERYRLNPTAIRRAGGAGSRSSGRGERLEVAPAHLELTLAYRPPLDWSAMLGYLAARATPGVEMVQEERYTRTLRVGEHRGIVSVSADRRASLLRTSISVSLLPVLVPVLARLRRLFDLDAEPEVIAEQLSEDEHLRSVVRRRPGLRVPGAVDGFDLALRAILGQQVSVKGATTLAGRLAREFGEAFPSADGTAESSFDSTSLARLPVSADRLAEASPSAVAKIGLPKRRAETIVLLARAVATGEIPELSPGADAAVVAKQLVDVPGIGEWTAEYVAMRALRWPDAFPHGDLGLRRAAGGMSAQALRRASERWRPWRAYAAMHLWSSLSDG